MNAIVLSLALMFFPSIHGNGYLKVVPKCNGIVINYVNTTFRIIYPIIISDKLSCADQINLSTLQMGHTVAWILTLKNVVSKDLINKSINSAAEFGYKYNRYQKKPLLRKDEVINVKLVKQGRIISNIKLNYKYSIKLLNNLIKLNRNNDVLSHRLISFRNQVALYIKSAREDEMRIKKIRDEKHPKKH